MALQKVGPLEEAINIIEESIRGLQQQKRALLEQLPQRGRRESKGYITHPLTGKRLYYDKKKEKIYKRKGGQGGR